MCVHDFLQLLIEHEVIAPDPNDPLREILRDLGPAPSVEAFLGTCVYVNFMYVCTHVYVNVL